MSTHPSAVSRLQLPEWRAVADHARATGHLPLREHFAADHRRAERFSFEACGLFVDHSKQRLSDGTLPLLVGLARACGLRERIDARIMRRFMRRFMRRVMRRVMRRFMRRFMHRITAHP